MGLVELYSGLKRVQTALRGTQDGAVCAADAYASYYEGTARGEIFSLTLNAITTAVAAGNLVGAAAAASTQFGLINPLNNTKNLVLLKFGMGVISGTPGAGPLFHGYISNIQSLTAASAGGTIRSNILGSPGSAAVPWSLAAGSALTGSTGLPLTQRLADFSATNTAQAIANGHVRCIEDLRGDIIVPPGVMWLPLWGAAGTSLLCGYSITWQEVPI
jgi:hypothetical protein